MPPSDAGLALGLQVATGASCAIWCLSGCGKLKGLAKGTGHTSFGAGKRYPGWFLPAATAHEFATVGAFAAGQTGLGLVGSAGFIGGVLYTNLNPWDGMVWFGKGPGSLFPVTVVATTTAVTTLGHMADRVANGDVGPSPAEGMEILTSAMVSLDVTVIAAVLQNPPLWVLAMALAGGILTGLALHANTQPPSKPAKAA